MPDVCLVPCCPLLSAPLPLALLPEPFEASFDSFEVSWGCNGVSKDTKGRWSTGPQANYMEMHEQLLIGIDLITPPAPRQEH